MVRRYDLDGTVPAPRGSRSSPERRRIASRVALVIALLASGFAVYYIHAWWKAPERIVDAFVQASRQGDASTMLSLGGTAEVRRLGLTPDKFQAMLNEAAGASQGFALAAVGPVSLSEAQSRYNRMVRMRLISSTGQPILDAQGRALEPTLVAYNTDAGWKIGISDFINQIVSIRYGSDYSRGRYAALCAKYDLPAEYLVPQYASWEPATPDEATGSSRPGNRSRVPELGEWR